MPPLHRPLAAAAFAACLAAGEAWLIPSPATAAHPAAEAAPAASPTTYLDEDGFAARGRLIIEGLSQEDLKKWRTGYFTGGDPGKYLPLAAMARLIRDPQDAMAREYLNDARSSKEHYHFAAVNWSRLLPIFGSVLTGETMAAYSAQAARTTDYLDARGTENHKTMWLTSGVVLPRFTTGDNFGLKSKAEAAKLQKAWLRRYVKDLYAYGQGEWDSSTYLMFGIHGMLNIYDFAEDPETRLIARAALDWMVAAYALKFTDGIYCGPNQRGHAGPAAESIADQTGWLWWGASRPIDAKKAAGFRYAMHPLTSSWRPNRILCNLAKRNVRGLPAEQTNSKPNYYFGQGISPVAGEWLESVYVDRQFTLGCLWKGFVGQTTRLQLVARADGGALSLNGGSPVGRNDGDGSTQRWKHFDGNGMYDQTAQAGPALVCLTRLPDSEAIDYSYVTIPAGVTPDVHGDWWIMRAGDTWIGVHGLGSSGQIGIADSDPAAKKKPADVPIIRFPGRRSGFVLQASTTANYADIAAFATALAASRLDISRFQAEQAISLTTLAGKVLAVGYQADSESAAVSINGQAVSLAGWPVYTGPLVQADAGILTVSDGNDGFRIDFTGDLPVYQPWKPAP